MRTKMDPVILTDGLITEQERKCEVKGGSDTSVILILETNF